MTMFEYIKGMDINEMSRFLANFDSDDVSAKLRFCENHCGYKNECSCKDDCPVGDEFIMKTYLNQEGCERSNDLKSAEALITGMLRIVEMERVKDSVEHEYMLEIGSHWLGVIKARLSFADDSGKLSGDRMENVVKELLAISNEFCDKYCKYPEKYTDKEKMWEEICCNCPTSKLQ